MSPPPQWLSCALKLLTSREYLRGIANLAATPQLD